MTFSIEQPVVHTCDFLSNNCQLVSRAGSVGFFSVFLFFPFFFFFFGRLDEINYALNIFKREIILFQHI